MRHPHSVFALENGRSVSAIVEKEDLADGVLWEISGPGRAGGGCARNVNDVRCDRESVPITWPALPRFMIGLSLSPLSLSIVRNEEPRCE